MFELYHKPSTLHILPCCGAYGSVDSNITKPWQRRDRSDLYRGRYSITDVTTIDGFVLWRTSNNSETCLLTVFYFNCLKAPVNTEATFRSVSHSQRYKHPLQLNRSCQLQKVPTNKAEHTCPKSSFIHSTATHPTRTNRFFTQSYKTQSSIHDIYVL